jgi:hypothetical protein
MSHRNMRMKFLLLILLVFSRILFSAEVKLRSENVFLCDIVEENPNSITILFKNQKYIIPRSEILAVNPDITGPHKSYQNSILTLEDNSVVKGLLVEETKDMVTIEKDKDLLAIPKNTIKELKKPEDKPYLLPDSYKVIEKEKPASSWSIGLLAAGFKNGKQVGESNYATYGGGAFIEPSFFKFSDRWLMGVQSEFFYSSGGLTYTFFQNFLYLQFNHILFGQNLYYKIGIGSSYLSLIETGQTKSIFRPAATGEFGWQNSIADKYILRIGIRENGIYENPKILDMFGLQISLGYRL